MSAIVNSKGTRRLKGIYQEHDLGPDTAIEGSASEALPHLYRATHLAAVDDNFQSHNPPEEDSVSHRLSSTQERDSNYFFSLT